MPRLEARQLVPVHQSRLTGVRKTTDRLISPRWHTTHRFQVPIGFSSPNYGTFPGSGTEFQPKSGEYWYQGVGYTLTAVTANSNLNRLWVNLSNTQIAGIDWVAVGIAGWGTLAMLWTGANSRYQVNSVSATAHVIARLGEVIGVGISPIIGQFSGSPGPGPASFAAGRVRLPRAADETPTQERPWSGPEAAA